MKKKLAIILILFLTQPLFAAIKSTTLDVQNMTCAICPITVKKALKKVAGVSEVEVSLEKKTADITYDDTQATLKDLIFATTNAGYPSTVHENNKAEKVVIKP